MVIGGPFDRIFLPVWIARLEDQAPRAKVIFEESGHHPQIEENGRRAEVVRDFLEAGR